MRRTAISGLFMLSGAAGLVFEVVWSRQLVLVFGNTTQALSAILTGFFGGMAVGSWYGGKVADRIRRPLVLYGALELVLVAVVLFTPVSFRLIHEVYRSAYGSIQSSPTGLSLVRFGLALAALAPATVLMGATLPTLTRYLARQADDLNEAFSALYVANTIGAVFGASIAGLVLIEVLGLSGALRVGAGCSGIAGLTALALHALGSDSEHSFNPARSPSGTAPQSKLRLALFVAFASGVSSLGYQVVWTRLIASGTGSSTYVFTSILTLFLVGLGFGAVEYKRIRRRVNNVIPILAAGQLVLAVLALVGMLLINTLDDPTGAFFWKALTVVLPATFVMGFSFPAATALLGGTDAQVGARSGLVLAVNTTGAIVATFLIPFVLIPLVGSPVSLALVGILNAVTALVLAFREEVTPQFRNKLVLACVCAIAAISGAVGTRSLFIDPEVVRLRKNKGTLYRSKEDEIASVQAGSQGGLKQLWVTGFSMTLLTVDAKLMPILPLMFRPQSTSVLVIAFGMGSAFRASLIAGLKTDAVELVPSVPQVFDQFYADAPAVRADPAGRIIIADGRNHIELTDKRYDIVVVDPPPPLESAGVSVISSREFYAASLRHLTPGGVMMQWVPWGQPLTDFKSHVRTFRDVYANVVVAAGPGQNGFYMLGSEKPLSLTDSTIRAIVSRPGVLADLSSAYDSPKLSLDRWALFIPSLVRLSGAQVATFAGQGPLITDDRPLPEYFLLRRRTETAMLDPNQVRAP